MGVLFEDHYLDVRRVDSSLCIKRFERDGLLTFTCRSRREFMESMTALGTVVDHRDAEPDGITVVEYDPDRSAVPGYRAMANGPLDLHTDGSGNRVPPRGVALWCEKNAGSGGESLFIDGSRLYRQLKTARPDVARALSRPESVVFASGNNLVRTSIFDVDESAGRLSVRLRSDELSYFTPDVSAYLPAFQQCAINNVEVMPLLEGQGYLIDNSRFLHGRRAFAGKRRMLRLLIDVGAAAPATVTP